MQCGNVTGLMEVFPVMKNKNVQPSEYNQYFSAADGDFVIHTHFVLTVATNRMHI